MPSFNILQFLDQLEADGGKSSDNGDSSYKCPACGSPNFKINLRTGRWGSFSCDCASTEAGKRKIRDLLSPAAKPGQPEIVPYDSPAKPPRPAQHREWIYTDSDGDPLIKVRRIDDGEGNRDIKQFSLVEGKRPADLIATVIPYKLREAQQALADGSAEFVVWTEGEPCADVLWSMGIPAVTSIGGAGKFKPDRDSGHLDGNQLVIAPDRDLIGIRHALDVAAAYPGARWLYAFPGSPQWNGSCPPNHGLDVADWVAQGATADDIKNAIVSTAPSQPVAEGKAEAQGKLVSDFLSDARNATAQLKAGLDRINALDDDDVRPLAYIALRRELGLQPKEFDRLLLGFIQGERGGMEGADLMKISQTTEVIIQDLLSSGLSVLCGDSHAGKTYAAYQLIEAVAHGKKFAGAFQATKGNCVIVQMDEPFPMVKKNWKVMGIEFDSGEVNVYDHWNYFQLHRLKQWVKKHDAKLVVLDSLKHIAGGEYEPKDSSISLMLYELDRFAMESGIAIVLLHHIVKPERAQPGKKPTPNEYFELFKEHMFGSTYLSASCTDVWMYWKFMPEGKSEPSYAMKAARCRSNIVDLDTIYEFAGSIDDCRLQHTGIRGQVTDYDELSNTVDRVLGFIRAQNGRSFTAKEICDRLNLGNTNYVSNILKKLLVRCDDIQRRKLSPGTLGGRPRYAFWSTFGSLNGARSEADQLADENFNPFSEDEGGAASGGAPANGSEPPSAPMTPRDRTKRLLGRS